MRRSHRLGACASLLALTAALTAGTGAAAANNAEAPPRSQVIATATPSPNFRATVTATTDDPSPAPVASAVLTIYVLRDGTWQQQDSQLIDSPNSWFYYPLTGERGVGEYAVSNAPDHTVSVQLLRTPSLGYSDIFRYHVANGQIVQD